MRKLLFVFVTSLFVFGNCKKSDSGSVSTDTYLPNNIGTNWTYKILTNGTTTTTATYTVSNRDTTALARTYQVITGTNGINQYYAKSGSDYFTFRAFNTTGLELNFLKDNVDVNGTWNTSQVLSGLTGLPVSSLTLNTLYTVKSKGGTRLVNTVTYNDVIWVQATLKATIPGFPSQLDLGYVDFYFAKNIGIIETNFQIYNALAGININELYTLTSYQIK